ncbi:Small-subunit processome Utp14 [Trinorchestia longiramus]|nr:Small-subunit processome Utp14 [Trinorchestia longiramus]
MAEELNKWAGVVHKMRTARQITFPLQDQKVSIFDQDHTTQPLTKTTLQKKLFGLMNDAGLMKAKEESAEEKAVREALSLEEVKERNRDAWRLRVLRDKIGKKAHHRNKTKSKKFHRELKKDRLKQQAAELENLKKTDPSKAVEKLQELEDIRIEERMSLKHKKSKWAAQVQRRANTDKELGRLVSESACEWKDPGSNPAADMVDAARNTAWDLGKQPNNYRSNYLTQEWARSIAPIYSIDSTDTCKLTARRNNEKRLLNYYAATVVEWSAARVLYRVSASCRKTTGSNPAMDTSCFSYAAPCTQRAKHSTMKTPINLLGSSHGAHHHPYS